MFGGQRLQMSALSSALQVIVDENIKDFTHFPQIPMYNSHGIFEYRHENARFYFGLICKILEYRIENNLLPAAFQLRSTFQDRHYHETDGVLSSHQLQVAYSVGSDLYILVIRLDHYNGDIYELSITDEKNIERMSSNFPIGLPYIRDNVADFFNVWLDIPRTNAHVSLGTLNRMSIFQIYCWRQFKLHRMFFKMEMWKKSKTALAKFSDEVIFYIQKYLSLLDAPVFMQK